jgi:WD40 repeat protein
MSVHHAGKMLAIMTMMSGAAFFLYLVMLGNLSDGPRFVLTGSESQFLRVAFSPDSTLVAAGQQDGTVKLWEVASAKEVFTISGQPVPAFSISDSVFALAFSPDGQTLAWGGGQKTITLFDIKAEEVMGRLPGHERWITAVAFNPNGATLATATESGSVRLWNLERKEAQVVFQADRLKPSGYQPPVKAIAYDPSGQTLAIGSLRNVFFLDMAKGGAIRATAEVSDRDITNLTFSPDGRVLAGGGQRVTLWDNATGKELAAIPFTPHSLAFSPDGKRLAIGRIMGEHAPNDVKIWDLDERRGIYSFICHHRPLSGLAWSPDGKTIATASCDKTVKLWDIDAMLKKAGK